MRPSNNLSGLRMNSSHVSSFVIKILCIFHIFLLTISNILVQYPFELFGFHTTWSAFTYPAIFILTDLTVRLSSASLARKIIFMSMFPGLLISYGVAIYLEVANTLSWQHIFVINSMPLRIALGCFFAYLIGQLLDIFVFQRVRKSSSWWLAPLLSSTAGNMIDTLVFFFVAFYHSSNLFLSQHWIEIAIVDVFFKIAISVIGIIPMYGIVLNKARITYSKQTMPSS